MGYRLPVFDLDVQAQRENVYTKTAQNELAIQLYQMGVFNPQQVDMSMMLLDMMDFRGKDELQLKLQQMGGMQQLLMKFQQIALGLAHKYEPQMAQQLAAVTQGMAADGLGAAQAMPPMGAVPGKPPDQAEGDEFGQKPKETSQMKNMRKRVESSKAVD